MLILGLKGFNGTCEGAGRGIDKEQFCNNEFTTEKKTALGAAKEVVGTGSKEKGRGKFIPLLLSSTTLQCPQE